MTRLLSGEIIRLQVRTFRTEPQHHCQSRISPCDVTAELNSISSQYRQQHEVPLDDGDFDKR